MKNLRLIFFFLLFFAQGTVWPGHTYAVADEDIRPEQEQINEEHFDNAIYYYDPLDSGVRDEVCNLSNTDEYPIKTPDIRDKQKLATAIDKYIKTAKPNSPFKNMGKYFVEGGIRSGINPVFLVAVANHETGLGTNRKSQGVVYANNAFGRTANPKTQPYVRPKQRNWYKWPSWQASIYSPHSPADGTKSKPDDMFQYIARRYGNNLTSGLESFLEGGNGAGGYAPSSDGNNIPAYIKDVNEVTNKIVVLAGEAIDIKRVSGSNQACQIGKSGDAISFALLYAWPNHRKAPYTTKKPAYEKAIKTAMAQSKYVGGGIYPGVDCGGFVTRVMQDSGYDPTYNSSNCNTVCQKRYLQDKWQKVKVQSTADLRPGDVAIQPGHTFMFVGTQPGFQTQIASASYSTNGRGWRAPMAGRESALGKQITWYRKR